MNKADAIELISDLLCDILDEDELELKAETTADSVEDWDSLAQVKLVLAIESSLGIQFETSEITAPENVGDLADLISAKTHDIAI